MFGYGHAKTLKKKNEALKGAMQHMSSLNQADQPVKTKEQIGQEAEEATLARRKAEEEGRARDEAYFGKNIQGLTPEQKSAMQYEANKQIKRNVQGLNRQLLGEQGRHGIMGRSGVAYAQQRDLAKMGQEAMGQSQRGLEQLNADMALKKLAAIYAGGKGEAAQTMLERQRAEDRAELEREKRRQQVIEDRYNQLFFNRL